MGIVFTYDAFGRFLNFYRSFPWFIYEFFRHLSKSWNILSNKFSTRISFFEKGYRRIAPEILIEKTTCRKPPK
jgi:hypothetical protein